MTVVLIDVRSIGFCAVIGRISVNESDGAILVLVFAAFT